MGSGIETTLGYWSVSVRAESQVVCSFELGSRSFCERPWASVFSPVNWSNNPREHLAHGSFMVCMLEAGFTLSAKKNGTGGNTMRVLAIHLVRMWASLAFIGYEKYLQFM